ncbi:MAG: dihydropteroate synthase [Candidatus Obscuribacterales bacterium]|nr:dihydropteroate synthase [Candidatus Obscuribacterales bacterium]
MSSRGNFNHQNLVHAWGERTLIMGIVNVTPDSFSGDGSLDATIASQYAMAQVHAGADLIDIGAESTRPGFSPVSVADEIVRILPVIKTIRETSNCLISIDTTKPEVLRAAVASGANILNSIWGLTPELLDAVRELSIPVVLMHNKHRAIYDGDVVDEVVKELKLQAEHALAIGIESANIILDPGMGFGKTAEHNLLVMQGLSRLVELGFPTLIGPSRKSFIGKITGQSVENRAHGTAATVALAIAAGVDIVRVHDVCAMLDVVKMTDSIVRNWRPVDWEKSS